MSVKFVESKQASTRHAMQRRGQFAKEHCKNPAELGGVGVMEVVADLEDAFARDAQPSNLTTQLQRDHLGSATLTYEHLGDVVLLASDGILSLSRVELMDCLHAHAASRAELLGAALIQAVEHKRDPKQDNCTIVAITGAQAAKPRSVPRGAGWGTLAVLAGIGVVLLCVALAALFW